MEEKKKKSGYDYLKRDLEREKAARAEDVRKLKTLMESRVAKCQEELKEYKQRLETANYECKLQEKAAKELADKVVKADKQIRAITLDKEAAVKRFKDVDELLAKEHKRVIQLQELRDNEAKYFGEYIDELIAHMGWLRRWTWHLKHKNDNDGE